MKKSTQVKEGLSIMGLLVLLCFPLWIVLIFVRGFLKGSSEED